MFSSKIHDLSQQIIDIYGEKKLKIVTAESCTGGLLAGALTQIPGSSAVIERGFVSYSNDAKVEVLGVMPELLARFGAVSAQVAEAMAQGAMEFSHADVGVSTTGIAGPTGDTPTKPIGLVYIGIANRSGGQFHYTCQFNGGRDEVREQTVLEALNLLLSNASSD